MSKGAGIFTLIIIAIIVALAMPTYRRPPRTASRQKACYSNIRVILGSLEMYNMDHSTYLEELDEHLIKEHLVNEGYLKTEPTKPDPKCRYSGRNLAASGLISCDFHGTIEGPEDGGIEGFWDPTTGDSVRHRTSGFVNKASPIIFGMGVIVTILLFFT